MIFGAAETDKSSSHEKVVPTRWLPPTTGTLEEIHVMMYKMTIQVPRNQAAKCYACKIFNLLYSNYVENANTGDPDVIGHFEHQLLMFGT